MLAFSVFNFFCPNKDKIIYTYYKASFSRYLQRTVQFKQFWLADIDRKLPQLHDARAQKGNESSPALLQ